MAGENVNSQNEHQWTIIKLLRWAAPYLESREIDSPRATGEILLAHALQCERIDLYLNYDQPLNDNELQVFKSLIQRRIRREPVAYILGVKEFWSLDFEVTPDVLIPRPETECLVEAALTMLSGPSPSQPWRILDLGTGSGAVIIALASEQPRHEFYAIDRNIQAVRVAHRNARRHQLGEIIHFFAADWLAALNPKTSAFDMIVSNPPYIPSAVIKGLQPEIHDYEPLTALDGNDDGLECYNRIIGSAHQFLKPGGAILLEIGHDQRDDVRRIAVDCGHYHNFGSREDYAGHDRIVWMHRRNDE